MKVKKTRNVRFYLAGLVGLVTFIVYLPALRNGFVYWDDNLYIFENPYIRSLDAAFFRWAFLDFHVSNWHPLTWVSHALDYAIWGLNPMGHHLTSIVLHAVNTFLVVLLVARLMGIGSPSSSLRVTPPPPAPPLKIRGGRGSYEPTGEEGGFSDRWVLIAAGVTGLLFGIHPLHVESVAWVAERKDLLCALFFLLSIMTYLKYVRRGEKTISKTSLSVIPAEAGIQGFQGTVDCPIKSGNDTGGGGSGFTRRFINKHYLLALGFFALALMSKPMAVSLPVVLLILDWYPLNRIRSLRTACKASVEKIPFFALSLASSVLTILAQRSGGAIVSVERITLSERTLIAAKSLVAYLGKMLLPVNLVPLYPYPKTVQFSSFEYPEAILIAIGITTVCVVLARKQKVWLSAWGYYVATLIPVLGIVQVGSQAMADRYTYLPSLGPFLIAGLCVAWVAERVSVKGRTVGAKILSSAAAVFVLVFLVYSTFAQIQIWEDSIVLWSYVIGKEPGKVSLAYSQRGAVYAKKGLTDQAIADLKKAIALNPSNYDAYMNLGVAFEKLGQFDNAERNFEKAIELKPRSYEAYTNRGILYEETGRSDKAISDYTKAITLNPSYFEAYNNRGVVFGKMGRFDQAIADYSETIRINPRHVDAHSNRAVAYTLTGRYDRAIEDFNAAVRLGPDDPMTYFNRGTFYRKTGNSARAFSDFQKACDLGSAIACNALRQLRRGVNSGQQSAEGK